MARGTTTGRQSHRIGKTTVIVWHTNNKIEKIPWSIALPGFVQLLNSTFLKGMLFIVWNYDEGAYWFEIRVRAKTSKGPFNPPYGVETITLSNMMKLYKGGYTVIKFVHQGA